MTKRHKQLRRLCAAGVGHGYLLFGDQVGHDDQLQLLFAFTRRIGVASFLVNLRGHTVLLHLKLLVLCADKHTHTQRENSVRKYNGKNKPRRV